MIVPGVLVFLKIANELLWVERAISDFPSPSRSPEQDPPGLLEISES